MSGTDELIDAVSSYREVLSCLLADPKTKPELEDECGVSRSTIDRWLSQLEAFGIIDRPDDRFELTVFGRIVVLKFDRLRTQLDHLYKMKGPLTTLPDEPDLAPVMFESADIRFYKGLAPELAEELFSHSGRVRLITPHIPSIISVFMFREPDPDIDLELIVDDEMLSQLDDNFTTGKTLLSVPDISFYQISDLPPFGLALVEAGGRPNAYVIFEGSNSGVGVISNDCGEALEYANDLYREYRNHATKCDLPFQDEPFEALRDSQQRVILMEMMNGNVSHEVDVMTRNPTEPATDEETPLEKLVQGGYLEWDRDSGSISKGPRFPDIEPILEMLLNPSDQDSWDQTYPRSE